VTDKQLDRNAARRLAILRHAEEVSGNVALVHAATSARGTDSESGLPARAARRQVHPWDASAAVWRQVGRLDERGKPQCLLMP
jgi:ketosteroid isomerase-like protein